MRIYFFNQETGVFQGEGFEDEKNLATLEGATTIAPPCYSQGEVPLFDETSRRWTLCRIQQREHVFSMQPRP